jgi:Holliday junction resolvase RusA-like endonuclease
LNSLQGAPPPKTARLVVRGDPRSKGRPRFANGRAYTPKETTDAEKVIRDAWRSLGEDPFEFDVLVDVTFYLATRRRKDLDNLVKLVLDALNKEAFRDDSQVVEINARKIFSDKDRARTEVTLTELILWPDER